MDKIRNLSVRKTIILYMAVSLVLTFLVSAFIVRSAGKIQERIWWKYVDEEQYFEVMEEETGRYIVSIPRPVEYEMTRRDHRISELCDFLQTYTVLILSILGNCLAVLLFYRNKLKTPIEELNRASRKIGENDLDFHIRYENRDEMGQLCREFEEMREQLFQNNRELWRMIEEEKALRAAIAHDIRSPLSVLKGYQEMLLDYLSDGTISLEQGMEMLKESAKQTRRMDDFIDAMSKMSSLEQRTLRPEEITAGELKEDIERELEILGTESGKQAALSFPDSGETFLGDKEVILEVLENLLSNALRYAETFVEISVELHREELKLCVMDDGIGFSESAEEATKAFHQQNAKDSLKHAGLGLYISRLYCEKHGGKLLLENRDRAKTVVTAVFRRIV